ncbi:hypothetical protein [Silvibacterium acidisoli]|uniref:hypothetical protein n=1 Tax=Acidobacteriaceae bacterium ZG23-2 TaxID=2883246 RepID=UPI00406D2E52
MIEVITSGSQNSIPDEELRGNRRQELERVLSSRTFSKSARLRSLLKYIGECSIEGRLDELSEQQIGISVFERNPGYNSAEDTIVRVTARHLRERLDLYYREEGLSSSLQISVPKGSYSASFRQSMPAPTVPAALIAAPEIPEATKPPVVGQPRSAGWPMTARAAVAACAVLALLLPILVYLMVRPGPNVFTRNPAGPTILWKALFTSGRKTFLVPGDASLDAYVSWEQRNVSLYDYTNQNYQHDVSASVPPSKVDVPLGARSVTPMADLRLVSDLVQIPAQIAEPQGSAWTEICYARDMVVANTHDANLILIGSATFNPWVTLYQQSLDFHVQWNYKNGVYTVTNKAPKAGDSPVYEYGHGEKPLTLIALTDNSQGQGRVLLIEGTSMGTTYAAVSFFKNEHLWKPVISAATDRSGKLHNFEVLLSSDFVRGGVSNTQIVSTHIH